MVTRGSVYSNTVLGVSQGQALGVPALCFHIQDPTARRLGINREVPRNNKDRARARAGPSHGACVIRNKQPTDSDPPCCCVGATCHNR